MGFTSPPSAIHSVLEKGARVGRTCSGISKYLPDCKKVAVKPVSTGQSSSTPKTKAFTNMQQVSWKGDICSKFGIFWDRAYLALDPQRQLHQV